jgi:signal transduction histidine kinase
MQTSAARHTDDTAISDDLLRQLAFNEKMADLGKISAGVAHELNTPLSVIVSAAQIILREEDVPETVLELVSRISSEAQRLSYLTKGLLNYGRFDETISEMDPHLTIDFVLNFLNFEAARRAVIVEKQFDHTLPDIQLDGNLLKQILLNIIMNALQAMEEKGGKLLIKTAHGEVGTIRFIITDNGPGIAVETIDHIFDRYFTTKKSGEGTGLGLFITKNLVERMGGAILVTSRIGGGTTFTITLPVIRNTTF